MEVNVSSGDGPGISVTFEQEDASNVEVCHVSEVSESNPNNLAPLRKSRKRKDATFHEKNTKIYEIKEQCFENIFSDDVWTWMSKLVCDCRDKSHAKVITSEPTNLCDIKEYLKDKNKMYLTAYNIDRDKNKPNPVLGYIAYAIEMEPVVHDYDLPNPTKEEVLYCYEFHVMDCHRRKGLGVALMNKLVDVAKQKGLRRVALTCLTKNKEAWEFYRNFGYKVACVNAKEGVTILSLDLEPHQKKAKVVDAREDTAALEDEKGPILWSCNGCNSSHKVENPWCYACRKWYHICAQKQGSQSLKSTRSKSKALQTSTPSVLFQREKSCSACKTLSPPMTIGVTNLGVTCYIISAMQMIALATKKGPNFLENTYGKSLLFSDKDCREQLRTYCRHLFNEESNKVPYDNSKFIRAITRLYKPYLTHERDRRDNYWIDHQEDPATFLFAFFTLAQTKEKGLFQSSVNTVDGFNGITLTLIESCECGGERILGGNIQNIQNDFILYVSIVHDDHGKQLWMQEILDEYFKHCRNPRQIGDDKSHCTKCSKPRFETIRVCIEPSQQFLLMSVKQRSKANSFHNKPIKFRTSGIVMPTSSNNADDKWTLKAVLLYRGNGQSGHYFVLTESGVYDDALFTYDDNRLIQFMTHGLDRDQISGNAYAHTYLFERDTTTSSSSSSEIKNNNCPTTMEVHEKSCHQSELIEPLDNSLGSGDCGWFCHLQLGGCGSYNADKSTSCKGNSGTCIFWFCSDCAILNYDDSCIDCEGKKPTTSSVSSSSSISAYQSSSSEIKNNSSSTTMEVHGSISACQRQKDELQLKGCVVTKIMPEEVALEFLKDVLHANASTRSIRSNMTSLQKSKGRSKSFRYKFDDLAMPENWDKIILPMIKTALPSLFGEEVPGRITKISLLLSSEGGQIQSCHVDAGW